MAPVRFLFAPVPIKSAPVRFLFACVQGQDISFEVKTSILSKEKIPEKIQREILCHAAPDNFVDENGGCYRYIERLDGTGQRYLYHIVACTEVFGGDAGILSAHHDGYRPLV
jgi:hypothetical protein